MPALPRARGTRALRRHEATWAGRQGPRRTRRGRTSCGIQVVVPEIDVDVLVRARLRSPELLRVEAHAVAVLRLLVARRGVRVGEDEDAVIAIDHAVLRARVARQARVAERVVV